MAAMEMSGEGRRFSEREEKGICCNEAACNEHLFYRELWKRQNQNTLFLSNP